MTARYLGAGHNKHPLHGRGKQWQRNDVERLLRFMVMQGYLDEELVATRDDIAVAYVRMGHKGQQLFDNNTRVTDSTSSSIRTHSSLVSSLAA